MERILFPIRVVLKAGRSHLWTQTVNPAIGVSIKKLAKLGQYLDLYRAREAVWKP